MQTTTSAKRQTLRRIAKWEPALKWLSLILGTLFIIFIAVYLSVTKYSIYRPKQFDQARFDQIAARIQSGKLTADGPIVALPPDLASASITGRAYLTKGLIFIPSWVGRKTLYCGTSSTCDEWLGGYVYSSGPLNIGAIPLPSHLNAPAFCRPSKAKEDNAAQVIDLYIYSPVGGHWYSADSFALGQQPQT